VPSSHARLQSASFRFELRCSGTFSYVALEAHPSSQVIYHLCLQLKHLQASNQLTTASTTDHVYLSATPFLATTDPSEMQ
jgi:hypothetical protein